MLSAYKSPPRGCTATSALTNCIPRLSVKSPITVSSTLSCRVSFITWLRELAMQDRDAATSMFAIEIRDPAGG